MFRKKKPTSSLLYTNAYIDRTASFLHYSHSPFLYPTPNHHSTAVSQSIASKPPNDKSHYQDAQPTSRPTSKCLVRRKTINFECNFWSSAHGTSATTLNLFIRCYITASDNSTPHSTVNFTADTSLATRRYDPSTVFNTTNQLRRNVFYFG